MKRKPWAIILLAALHILAPLGNLFINAHRAHHTLLQHWNWWLYVMPRPLFLSYVVLPILAGIFIFICKRWSYWLYLVCLALIFVSNIYGFSTNANLTNLILLLVLLIVDLLAVAYFVVPAVRNVYLDPRLRWWEAAPRYIFSNAVEINGTETETGTIKNISEGGLFVLSNINLFEGSNVKLSWLFEGTVYAAEGKVVYKSNRAQAEGYGIQFHHSSDMQKNIKMLCAKLRERGQIVPDRLPGPEDSFTHWLKNLVLKREGLFPKR
ncbi:MAG TPA: PilZ domain-containing protein [Bdellovibrio sp.]|uniref:PilZ domain-containing protein n=1 Tax=Bdellovibrio sp. TaxID=28201 RepID=UPI002F1799F6